MSVVSNIRAERLWFDYRQGEPKDCRVFTAGADILYDRQSLIEYTVKQQYPRITLVQ
jgi:hypothetical protein